MFSFEVKRDSVLRDGVHGFFPVLLQMVQSEHNSSPPPQQQQQNKQTNKPKDKTLKSHPPPKKDTHPVKRTHNFNVRTVDISAIQMFIFPDGFFGVGGGGTKMSRYIQLSCIFTQVFSFY